MSRFRIEKLARDHDLDSFDCGQEALNRFLKRFAFASPQANTSQTHVGLVDDQVIGYYTLVVAEISPSEAHDQVGKGLARHRIPLMLLARLAVARQWQGKGVGSGLLQDAMLRTLQAADIAGIRALAAHAKDGRSQNFYEHFDFLPSPTDPLHLYVLIKDIRKALGS